MRKLILCATALLCGAVMFAQNDPITDTSGDTSPNYKASGVTPSADGANTGLSIQNGDFNKVWVRQAGTSQDVYTHQDNGSGLGGNLATIMQTGSVQDASGVENKVNVMQSGTANQSNTKQEGDFNMAITNQGRNGDAGSAGNKAYIRQGVAQQAENNYAAINQDGDDNQAMTQQTYDNSDAWTQQWGYENKALVLQDAGPNNTDGHSAMVEQRGFRNESKVTQEGLGGRNTATMSQWGKYNQGRQIQTTDALKDNLGNRAGMQQGLINTQYILNPLMLGPTGLFATVGPLDPQGIFFGSIPLDSHNAIGFQIQSGHENQADMIQVSGMSPKTNYGEQVQSGDNNGAAMIQSHYQGHKNYAKQVQAGSGNFAALGQTGSGMKALTTQFGDDNEVFSSQRGKFHRLNVHQRGNENWATTAQAGLHNVALVVQRDGQSYSVEQNLDLMGLHNTSAGGNQADILQLGPDGDFIEDAIDCYFDPQLVPDYIPNIPDINIDPICVGCGPN